MRDVAIVTVARSDWGIYRPVLRALVQASGLAPRILASGMHLSERFGMTVRLVEEDAAGFGVPVERVPMEIASDAPEAIAAAMGGGTTAFAKSYARRRPDVLLVLGDRFEMFSAVAAAVPFVLPVFHIHGGERTAGAFDDALRHAMTKMSHVHFVSTREYARRVRQLGEDPWRIVLSGAPAIDELKALPEQPLDALGERIGFELRQSYLLVAYHPTTLEPGASHAHGMSLLRALGAVDLPVLFVMPNADPGGEVLRVLIRQACETNSKWRWLENVPFSDYATLLKHTAAFVGNSSSGIIEAPTFQVPVVNVGRRQEGRVRGSNVIDVDPDAVLLENAIKTCLRADWRARHLTGDNPYDAGGAGAIIARTVGSVALDQTLSAKGFVDVPVPRQTRPVSEFTVADVATLHDVVACIDRNRTGIAVVVDERGAVSDVVTDGDIRRAMLAGASLADPVQGLRSRRRSSPCIGSADDSEADWLNTMRDAGVRQLPLVKDGVVVELVLIDEIMGTFGK